MNHCPKCSGSKISGPRYERNGRFGREGLVYCCETCGYSEDRPTHDQQYDVVGYVDSAPADT